jgi:hypothetical protein
MLFDSMTRGSGGGGGGVNDDVCHGTEKESVRRARTRWNVRTFGGVVTVVDDRQSIIELFFLW